MGQQNFGGALGDGFVLNEATLMIGALGSALDLTEAEHSVGLFKNLAIANDKTFQPLQQGVNQDTVHNQKTTDNWTISGNGYEYNPRTIMYALGQSGFSADPLATRVRLGITVAATIGTDELTLAATTGLAAGDWIVLYNKLGDNNGLAYKIESIATNVITLDRDLVAPVAVGDEVIKSTLINTNDPQSCSGAQYFSAKIVSSDVNCNPIVIIAPKVQVTSGLNLAFGSTDYSSIAYQLTAMALTKKDAGYDQYIAHGKSKVFMLT